MPVKITSTPPSNPNNSQIRIPKKNTHQKSKVPSAPLQVSIHDSFRLLKSHLPQFYAGSIWVPRSWPLTEGDLLRSVEVERCMAAWWNAWNAQGLLPPRGWVGLVFPQDTLWLCQDCYWEWPLIVSFPMQHGGFP